MSGSPFSTHRRSIVLVASTGYQDLDARRGLKTLRNKLSEYVCLAAGGETVLVTDRDRIVAELVAPRASCSSTPADALLADAVRKGLVSPPLFPPGSPPPRLPIAPLRDVLADLDEDRTER